MQKLITQFKTTIQGVESTFHFDQSCPVAIAKESVFECLKWLGQIEDHYKAQEEAKSAEEKSEDQPSEQPQEVINDQSGN